MKKIFSLMAMALLGITAAHAQMFAWELKTTTGTYTFDGEKGVFDGEQTFTYDKKAETITVEQKIDDEELAAMFGTDKLTLTFSQQ
jgi:hypothetical protein